MNKKIKELAEEFRINFSIDENSREGIHWDNVDEFAELIIKESARFISTLDSKPMSHPDSASYLLLEHFGVEE